MTRSKISCRERRLTVPSGCGLRSRSIPGTGSGGRTLPRGIVTNRSGQAQHLQKSWTEDGDRRHPLDQRMSCPSGTRTKTTETEASHHRRTPLAPGARKSNLVFSVTWSPTQRHARLHPIHPYGCLARQIWSSLPCSSSECGTTHPSESRRRLRQFATSKNEESGTRPDPLCPIVSVTLDQNAHVDLGAPDELATPVKVQHRVCFLWPGCEPSQVHVLNWTEELTRLVPVP